ncbi:efflux RND transporter permease subunit [Prolixibacter sp. SD074]|uniref:efflux RND transporter permease subunit n=1 Tax=Prolixibacter sp. SD074 TaxID=2652391 RepID=UPI00127927CF|nr:efflux RND transporter permease subunit [Prolixibacter sp. SD074]GET28494.1 multidrug transporter AcrB [Prolixibacter sp. SD074]
MKNLPKFSIDNYQFVLVLFLVLLVAGIHSFLTMPRSEDPPVVTPGAVVTVIYPGASPMDMEELVVTTIEEKINELENIDNIATIISDGFAIFNISFDYGNYDEDEKYNEVIRQVNNIRTDLPEDIREINFKKKTTTDTKILQLALASEYMDFEQMDEYAENLKGSLEEMDGIKSVEILAVPEKQVKIALRADKMVNMGITTDNIINAIDANNQNIPGGELYAGRKSFNIKTSGSYKDLDEIRNTVVGSVQGKLVYLKDVATVEFGYENNNYLARFNGKRCIFITAEQKENVNILDLTDQINAKTETFKSNLPPGLRLEAVHSQAESVRTSVNGFIINLIQGIILVGLFIFLAIGFKPSLVVMLAIPSSILIGLGFVDLAGYGLQNISIAALVIALGLLVDNSIVVTENVERYLQAGLPARDAAIKGTSQVVSAITSSTLTTLAAFIPIAMIKDSAGDFMKSLPVTVTATLTVSLVIAISVSPLLLSKFIRIKPGVKPKEQPLQKRLKKFIRGPFRKLLEYCLSQPKRVLFITIVVFLSAIFVLFRFVGFSFFPKAEKPSFMIQAQLPQGANLNETNRVASYVEATLDTIPEIKHYASNIGHGNPKVYYNYFPRDYAKNLAEFFVELKEYNPEGVEALLDSLRGAFSAYPAADIRVKEFAQGVPIQYPVEVIIYGDNLDELTRVSEEIKAIVQQQPGAVNVENKLEGVRTDLFVHINKNKAALLGVPISEIDKTVRIYMNGSSVSKFRNEEGKEYDMVLGSSAGNNATFEDFGRIYVKSLSGEQIPLSQLARIEFKKGPGVITHYNSKRSATIGADVEKGYNTAEVTRAIEAQLKNYPFPSNFNYHLAGEIEAQGKSFSSLGAAALIAFLMILAILVFQFHSFRQPFIIFAAVPMALIGSFYALFVTGYTFSFTAFVGAVALLGIVINDAIVLIDFTNELRKEGKTVHQALTEAAQVRFMPILITSFTTIGGLLPLTLQGGTFWGPMGWTIIGGLTLSTTLTLLIVPVLYKVLEKENSKKPIKLSTK